MVKKQNVSFLKAEQQKNTRMGMGRRMGEKSCSWQQRRGDSRETLSSHHLAGTAMEEESDHQSHSSMNPKAIIAVCLYDTPMGAIVAQMLQEQPTSFCWM